MIATVSIRTPVFWYGDEIGIDEVQYASLGIVAVHGFLAGLTPV